jgi:hypothetical protein
MVQWEREKKKRERERERERERLILIPDSKYTKMRVENHSVQLWYVIGFDTHLLQKQNHYCKIHYATDITLHTVIKYFSSYVIKHTPYQSDILT